jgi:branched-chain amino acid transport system ATP-binding protein
MEDEQHLLEVHRLQVSYGRILALRELSLVVDPGDLVLVLGPNGAGKSSLLAGLAGLVLPRGGRVLLGGRDVTKVPASRRVRLGVSLVPEGRGVLRGLSVRDNLVLGWRAAPRSVRPDLEQALAQAFDLFPRLGERQGQDCATLSGGEMQMLAIARALAAKPRLLLLDEPSLGLAPKAVSAVYQALDALHAAGLSMLVVEQKDVPLGSEPAATLVLRHGAPVLIATGRRPSEEELAALYLGEGAR